MIFSQALRSFVASAITGVSPVYMVTPLTVGASGNRGSTSKKRKSIAPESSSRRQSPRLHQNMESQPTLSAPQRPHLVSLRKNILDSIAEGEDDYVPPSTKSPSVASSSSEYTPGDHSPDLLEKTQNTVIPESQCDEVMGTALPPRTVTTLFDLEPGVEEEFSTDNVVDDHDPILDDAAAHFSFPDRMKHFISPLLICENSREAVEKAILLEAGSIVSSEHVTNANARNESLVLRYKECVQSLDDALFAPTMKEDMVQKRHNSRSNKGGPATLRGKQLWIQYDKVKCEMRKVFAQLGPEYHNLPSGRQLYQKHEEIIRSHYKEAYPSDCEGMEDDEIDLIIPETFWLWNSICKNILSVKVHRKNTDITTVPSAAPPGQTRNVQRQMQANRVRKERQEAAVERDTAVSLRVGIHQEKEKINIAMARESILSSRKKRESAVISDAGKKLKALKFTKAIFIEKHGEERWKEEVNKCMIEMLGGKPSDEDMFYDAVNTRPDNASDEGGGSVTATTTNHESEDDSETDD